MLNFRDFARRLISVLFAALSVATFSSLADAQANFTLSASPFQPAAIDAGGFALSTITVGTINGFNGAVALSCAVTPQQTSDTPACTLSQTSVRPPAQPTLTITTSSLTPATFYTVAVTGTASTGTQTLAPSLNLTVLTAIPSYTLTVSTAITPTSLHAGSSATAELTVTPSNGYTGSVTLSCSAISPSVTPAPICAFKPQPVVITNASGQSSTLTISTTGASAVNSAWPGGIFAAMWLPLCAMSMIRVRGRSLAPGKRSLRWLWLACMTTVFFGMIGCGSSTSTTKSTGTPVNTYVFTITGADANKLAPSNGKQTVTLTVN